MKSCIGSDAETRTGATFISVTRFVIGFHPSDTAAEVRGTVQGEQSALVRDCQFQTRDFGKVVCHSPLVLKRQSMSRCLESAS